MCDWVTFTRGQEIGVVAACCAEGSDYVLIVDKVSVLSRASVHSAVCTMASTGRAAWRMDEVAACQGWCAEESHMVVIVP